jgi:hypothetical protein
VIKRLARGEISKRAARDELTVSDARINAMVAHIRGEAANPTIARRAMDDKLARPSNTDLYRKLRCCWLSAAAAAIDAELGNASRQWGQVAN